MYKEVKQDHGNAIFNTQEILKCRLIFNSFHYFGYLFISVHLLHWKIYFFA